VAILVTGSTGIIGTQVREHLKYADAVARQNACSDGVPPVKGDPSCVEGLRTL
jgi:hypothetical protein